MAVIITAQIAGGSAESDAAMVRETGIGEQIPAGALFRATGPIPGGWQVVSGWESMEAFQRFQREKLQPAFAKLGLQPTSFAIWAAASIRAGR